MRPGMLNLVVGNVRTANSRGLARYRLHVFADKRVVEVYVHDGEAAVFNAIDIALSDRSITAAARVAPPRCGGPGFGGRGGPAGNARVDSIAFWPMKSARFSLDQFKL